MSQSGAFAPRAVGWLGRRVLVFLLAMVAAFAGASCLALRLVASGLPDVIAVHAAAMVTGWGVLLPAGAIAARYHKVVPGRAPVRADDDPAWWFWHRVLQTAGLVLAAAGLGAILSEGPGGFATLHGRCGLLVLGLAALQLVSAALRGTKGGPTDAKADPLRPETWRGDHYDMTARRRLFEAWHKTAGWAAIALSLVTILLGADLTGAPDWFIFLIGCLAGGSAMAILDGMLRRRWIATHAALWGHRPAEGAS